MIYLRVVINIGDIGINQQKPMGALPIGIFAHFSSHVLLNWCQDVAFPEAYEGLELADLHRVHRGWVQCGMVNAFVWYFLLERKRFTMNIVISPPAR